MEESASKIRVDKGRIAKNTLYLYVRMFLVMGLGIFTSRIILEYLGIDNYGIYNSVGGIVGLIAFANTAISTGVSRFITFGLGEDNPDKLKRTFSTLFTIQAAFALLVVLVAETGGLWFVYHKLQITPSQMPGAVFAYHASIAAVALSMMCNPFGAAIIAHEHIHIFAWISIYDVVTKLGICFLLAIWPDNLRLQYYSLLLLAIQVSVMAFYYVYSRKKFKETNIRLTYDKGMIREIAAFSGWSLFAATSLALNGQGMLVVLNMFFSPAIVAARAISLTVSNAASSLMGNFRQAMNPQIVKQYAAGNYRLSRQLVLQSTEISYYLMMLLSVPVIFTAQNLLSVWLKEVPPYTCVFLQLVIVQGLFSVFDSSLYIALYAKGQLKQNALISPALGFLMFPVVYILFRMGASPVALSWASVVVYFLLGMVIKPILLVKYVDYSWPEILLMFFKCTRVSTIAFPLGYLVVKVADIYTGSPLTKLIITFAMCVLSTAFTVYSLGLSRTQRSKINRKAVSLLHIK